MFFNVFLILTSMFFTTMRTANNYASYYHGSASYRRIAIASITLLVAAFVPYTSTTVYTTCSIL